MNKENFYDYLQKQIILLVGWSLLTGLGFLILCFNYNVSDHVTWWYGAIFLVSIWGLTLYQEFKNNDIDVHHLESWYLKVRLFIYMIFGLWSILFIIYSKITENNIYLVVIFTQISASVIAASFLFSDKKLFIPVILLLMYPLVIYFLSIHEMYGYFLSGYAVIFLGLLLYSSYSSNALIQQIYYQAQHDSLTGLFNRRYFMDYLEQMLHAFEKNNKFAYILLIDLDHFKTINDSLGHEVGDALLVEVSNRIKAYCEKSHLIARIGGDEFMIVSYEFERQSECKIAAEVFAKAIGKILKETYVLDYHQLHISASIGVRFLDGNVEKKSQVMKEADIAMYEAKSDGRDSIVNFNTDLAKEIDTNLEIERKLYFAVKKNEIDLNYQAQVNEEKEIIGCEVLVRWHNQNLGAVSPVEFISIAEKTGMIIELGNYILEESFKTLNLWDKKGIVLEQFSINISIKQLVHESFIKYVESMCNKYLNEVTRKKVIFEITESLLAEDIYKIIKIINELKNFEIRFSMDDFGTGYSSLNYLREMPIDELKIDRAFVSRLGENDSDEKMITTILSLANIFNLNVVAEGVETGEQFRFLLDHECHIFQGFYFAKPLRRDDFEILLMRNKIS